MFLLSPEDQQRLIHRIAEILVPCGRLLFTSPAEPLVWNDAMTGLESRSPGAEEYRRRSQQLVSRSLVSSRMKAKTTISMLSKRELPNPGDREGRHRMIDDCFATAPMVFGIIPECCSAFLRNERSASARSPKREGCELKHLYERALATKMKTC